MSHDHHHHTHSNNKKALMISFYIITTYMIIEAIGGFITNSLALLSDAGHMFSDAVSLGIALLAFTLGERTANSRKTFGYKRFEILAASFNGISLIIIAIFILIEAFRRFLQPPEIASTGMLGIAFIGLLVNILVAWILMRGGDTEDNLNVRAAFLHVIGDMLGSIGAIIAALLILFFNWTWADPLASVIVALLVLISGWRVTKDSLQVLMEGTPKNINMDEVVKTIENVDGVISIHDLHVWTITSGHNALSCHAVVDSNLSIREGQIVLRSIENDLQMLGIGHVTIQLEDNTHPHSDELLCNHNESLTVHVHNH